MDLVWLIVGATLPAFAVSCLAAAALRRVAPAWGLVDKPGHRKVHTTPTPLGGGLAIFLGVAAPLAVGQTLLWLATAPGVNELLPAIVRTHLGGLLERMPSVWLAVGLGGVLVGLGLLDDRIGLSWKVRLLAEVLVALVVVARGWTVSVFLDMPWLTGAITVLWIVGLINSFNMLDNMDGLSGGVGAIACGMFALVLLAAPARSAQPQLFVAGFLLLLVGSLAGFLVHNRPPARIFMGDAGSYFIGYWIALGTILATFAGEGLPRHTILAPLCVLAVPLYDTTSVVAIRLLRGKSPFEGDKNHFSHRLTDLGMTKPQAVLTIYLVTFITGLGALLLYRVTALADAGAVLAMVAGVLAIIGILERAGWSQRRE